ncbi:glucose-6-phosphate isomerase [Porphyromonas sp.]
MLPLRIDTSFATISSKSLEEARIALNQLIEGGGLGCEYKGWLDLPFAGPALLEKIETVARDLHTRTECVVCIGIGGSYLGAKAVIDALTPPSFCRETPSLLFAGHHLDSCYLSHLQDYLKGKSFGIIYISKSGGTLEPSIAFHQLRHLLVENAKGDEDLIRNNIVVITDPEHGSLRAIATHEGYRSFSIPPSVGGRYSVLSAVGLLPLAYSGIDIRKLLHGAKDLALAISRGEDEAVMPLLSYAGWRIEEYRNGKKIEILSTFSPTLHSLQEWWKQLFAESEGKDGKGIFSTTASFSTDLHSLGQWIQDGERSVIETMLSVEEPSTNDVIIQGDKNFRDGLDFLTDKSLHWVNRQAEEATCIAHSEGGVPLFRIKMTRLDEYNLGMLLLFFEMAAGVSGYMMQINPFDQPGVEAYKQKMNQLLNKPV